jgi:membrane protein YqaA with SNARE-associated domain
VRRFLDWVLGIAEMLGSPGLFLLAFLDSSFLSLPEVVDVLMVGLVAKYPARLLWYAAMPTIGSIAGSYTIYALARRGGEAFLRRRLHERHVDRAFDVFRKYGLLAVAVPSVMPPPVPFKIFVLTAGAARVSRRDFLVAISVGRGARFFGEALLAAWYGPAAVDIIREHAVAIAVVITVIIVAAAGAWVVARKRG